MSINASSLLWFVAGIVGGIVIGLRLKAVLAGFIARRRSAAFKPSLIVAAVMVVAAVAVAAWLLNPGEPAGAVSAEAGAGDGAAAAQAAAPQSAGTMEAALTRLEQRLGAQGGSDSDWELLAQTYDFMGRAADAKSARSHRLPVSADTAVPAPLTAAAAAPRPNASENPSKVAGDVEIADALKSKVPPGLTLFIIAKAIDSPGIPVAILRTTTEHWPLSFSLDDASAMVPERKLSTTGAVTVEARISRSGMATPQPGDFQSVVMTVNPRDRKSVRLLIDHVIG